MTETLGSAVPADIEALVDAVLKSASDHGVALSTAESCTGGLIASMLTDVEGRSHAFERRPGRSGRRTGTGAFRPRCDRRADGA